MGDLSEYPDGQYVDEAGRAIVVLHRPDQPTDYSQVKGVVVAGVIYPIAEGQSEVSSTMYRSLLPNGRVGYESDDYEEVIYMSRDLDAVIQRQETLLVTVNWTAM